MRANKWLALHTPHSRRKADELIAAGRVTINGKTASMGIQIEDTDEVIVDGTVITARPAEIITIMLNKPAGVVCSRNGQGAPTVYSLLPPNLHHLDMVGRLDKDTSGLLLFTNDGELNQRLTHPSHEKEKVYKLTLFKPLEQAHETAVKTGVELADGVSKLELKLLNENRSVWEVTMHEGRNRQIRRTFEELGYAVKGLHRSAMGEYRLGPLETGKIEVIK